MTSLSCQVAWAGESLCFLTVFSSNSKDINIESCTSHELKVLESSVIFKSTKGPVIKTVETFGEL